MLKIQAKHILVDHEYEANDLVSKLKAGESFEDLAQAFSKCPSGKRGGDLGEFTKGMMVKDFEDVAFALKAGEVSRPVQTRFGHHLILRTK